MDNTIPTLIQEYILRYHVVNIACYTPNDLWAASCFYAFDPQHQCLIILTDRTTRHAQLMLANPHITGTIAGQPHAVEEIEGIQFRAIIKLLEGQQQAEALTRYFAKHPIAQKMKSDVWAIYFNEIKHTQNKPYFGHKTYWRKGLNCQVKRKAFLK